MRPNAPINIFIHGGAWRAGTSADAAYLAETFVDAGAHFVAVDFNNVIETNGNLMTMADQVRRAVAWVYRNALSFGGDQNRLYVSGVSSGGHLASVVLMSDWQRDFGLPVNIVKGGLCGSGMYDLYPVTFSARSNYIKFTNDVVEALSAQRHLDKLVAPVIVAHGTLETPEFQRQSREFTTAMKTAGKSVTFLVGEGYNHYELHETLGNPYGLLGRAVLEQMKLKSPKKPPPKQSRPPIARGRRRLRSRVPRPIANFIRIDRSVWFGTARPKANTSRLHTSDAPRPTGEYASFTAAGRTRGEARRRWAG